MTRRDDASPEHSAPDDAEPAALTPPALGSPTGTFELGGPPPGIDLTRGAAALQQALGLGPVVAGPDDAPPLPLDGAEPPAVSRLDPRAAGAEPPLDPAVLSGLRRLAGPDPSRARATLAAALRGEPVDPRALPDTRALLVGLARVVVAHGVDADHLLDAVAAAMLE